ncbi:glycosyltransferase family 61 protein, partial [Paracoccus acridae]|uniref:glycosyltransferase family 61 protein n=1 Tax=Paracoccus acridae TaxID=1795310 RepID=UPI00166413FA
SLDSIASPDHGDHPGRKDPSPPCSGRLRSCSEPTIYAPKVIFPDLPMRRRSWIHPQALEVFGRLRELSRLSTVDTPERVYVSRSRVRGRKLINEAAVECLFIDKGFTVIHPQDLPMEDQIKIFSNARLLAAAGGSAAHNAVFAPEDTKVLILSSEGWLVNADILLSQTSGRLAYVFGHPLNLSPSSHRTQSDWIIDISQVRMAIRGHFDI